MPRHGCRWIEGEGVAAMKKFDLHVHSVYSRDSATPVEKLAEKFHSAGFAGFALTDHGNMDGIGRAKAYIKRKKLPLEVIPGCEFRVAEGEIIGLFIEEMAHAKDAGELIDSIHSQGGLAILPHPFDSIRKSACPPSRLPHDVVNRLDGIETFNARCGMAGPNEKALEFAKARQPNHSVFAQTGGSDAHFLFEAGAGWTLVPKKMSIEKALRSKSTSAGGNLSPLFVHGPTTLVKYAKKWGLLRPPF